MKLIGAVVGGARLSARRMASTSSWLVVVLAIAATAVIALIEVRQLAFDAATRVLAAVMGVLLPLTVFTLSRAAQARGRNDDASWALSRYGLSRRQVVLGGSAALWLGATLVALVLVGVALLIAHAGVDRDLVVSASIAALAAGAYVGWFSFGACFGRKGRASWVVLAADFILGGGDGAMAVVFPRAHVRNMIGGASVVELSQAESSVLLAGMAMVLTLLAAWLSGER